MDSHEGNKDAGGEGSQNFNESSDLKASNIGRFRVTSVPMETDEANSLSTNLLGATCKSGVSPEPEDKNRLSPSRFVRSTSLKNDKTPKKPGEKKMVRFADALGLDLTDVRHFIKSDNAPVIPPSAFADLKIDTVTYHPLFLKSDLSLPPKATACSFVPQFKQPASEPNFLHRVRQKQVCLENTLVYGHRVAGIVRIMNLSFHKVVQVRYTTDGWLSFTDIDLEYVPTSSDGQTDKFKFVILVSQASPGDRLSFVIRYVVNGDEFWDNNNGNNYVMKYEASKKHNYLSS